MFKNSRCFQLWIVLSVLLLSACDKPSVGDTVYVIEGVSISSDYMLMAVGDTENLQALIKPSDIVITTDFIKRNNLEGRIYWKSDNEKIATVSPDGVVHAVGPGICNVSVVCGMYRATCRVEIRHFELAQLYGAWKAGTDSLFIDFDGTARLGNVRYAFRFDGMRLNLMDDMGVKAKLILVSVNDSIVKYHDKLKESDQVLSLHRIAYCLGMSELLCNNKLVASKNDSLVMAVDMGLSDHTLWAMANLGSCSPELPGSLYSWAECDPRNKFSLESYKWYDQTTCDLTKYMECSTPGAYCLDASDDAAQSVLGSSWHVPSYNEMKVLFEECGMVWARLNGVDGALFLNKKSGLGGPKLFLPVKDTYAGSNNRKDGANAFVTGAYWTSSFSSVNPFNADYFSLSLKNYLHGAMGTAYRYSGICIRPVWNRGN